MQRINEWSQRNKRIRPRKSKSNITEIESRVLNEWGWNYRKRWQLRVRRRHYVCKNSSCFKPGISLGMRKNSLGRLCHYKIPAFILWRLQECLSRTTSIFRRKASLSSISKNNDEKSLFGRAVLYRFLYKFVQVPQIFHKDRCFKNRLGDWWHMTPASPKDNKLNPECCIGLYQKIF